MTEQQLQDLCLMMDALWRKTAVYPWDSKLGLREARKQVGEFGAEDVVAAISAWCWHIPLRPQLTPSELRREVLAYLEGKG